MVGLGNPGTEYLHTRHNIGFVILDAFAKAHGVSFEREPKIKAKWSEMQREGLQVVLIKPLTYMNESGEAVEKAAHRFACLPEGLLVVVDDADLPFGILRLKKEGSAGGHNGLKSIEHALKTQGWPRLRVGIGQPPEGALEDWVLSNFSEEENRQLPKIIDAAKGAIETWLFRGIDEGMNEFNNRSHTE